MAPLNGDDLKTGQTGSSGSNSNSTISKDGVETGTRPKQAPEPPPQSAKPKKQVKIDDSSAGDGVKRRPRVRRAGSNLPSDYNTVVKRNVDKRKAIFVEEDDEVFEQSISDMTEEEKAAARNTRENYKNAASPKTAVKRRNSLKVSDYKRLGQDDENYSSDEEKTETELKRGGSLRGGSPGKPLVRSDSISDEKTVFRRSDSISRHRSEWILGAGKGALQKENETTDISALRGGLKGIIGADDFDKHATDVKLEVQNLKSTFSTYRSSGTILVGKTVSPGYSFIPKGESDFDVWKRKREEAKKLLESQKPTPQQPVVTPEPERITSTPISHTKVTEPAPPTETVTSIPIPTPIPTPQYASPIPTPTPVKKVAPPKPSRKEVKRREGYIIVGFPNIPISNIRLKHRVNEHAVCSFDCIIYAGDRALINGDVASFMELYFDSTFKDIQIATPDGRITLFEGGVYSVSLEEGDKDSIADVASFMELYFDSTFKDIQIATPDGRITLFEGGVYSVSLEEGDKDSIAYTLKVFCMSRSYFFDNYSQTYININSDASLYKLLTEGLKITDTPNNNVPAQISFSDEFKEFKAYDLPSIAESCSYRETIWGCLRRVSQTLNSPLVARYSGENTMMQIGWIDQPNDKTDHELQIDPVITSTTAQEYGRFRVSHAASFGEKVRDSYVSGITGQYLDCIVILTKAILRVGDYITLRYNDDSEYMYEMYNKNYRGLNIKFRVLGVELYNVKDSLDVFCRAYIASSSEMKGVLIPAIFEKLDRESSEKDCAISTFATMDDITLSSGRAYIASSSEMKGVLIPAIFEKLDRESSEKDCAISTFATMDDITLSSGLSYFKDTGFRPSLIKPISNSTSIFFPAKLQYISAIDMDSYYRTLRSGMPNSKFKNRDPLSSIDIDIDRGDELRNKELETFYAYAIPINMKGEFMLPSTLDEANEPIPFDMLIPNAINEESHYGIYPKNSTDIMASLQQQNDKGIVLTNIYPINDSTDSADAKSKYRFKVKDNQVISDSSFEMKKGDDSDNAHLQIASGDVNISSDIINLESEKLIYMRATGELNLSSTQDLKIISNNQPILNVGAADIKTVKIINLESEKLIYMRATGELNLSSTQDLKIISNNQPILNVGAADIKTVKGIEKE